MSETFIQRYQTFRWKEKNYLCLFTSENCWWVYLPPLFGKRTSLLKKKYPTFSFRACREFGKFSLPNFPRIRATSLFLCFQEFEELAKKENQENVIFHFREQLDLHSFLTPLPKPVETQKVNSENSTIIPAAGSIYVMKFPSLKIGKVGITESWKKRLFELQREYSPDGEMVFREVAKNARAVEFEVLEWLRKEKALTSIQTGKGVFSRETFCLKKISEEKVCEFLQARLVREKQSTLVFKETEKILLHKLQTNDKFALEFYKARDKNFIEILVASLSSEARERIATEYFPQNLFPPELHLPTSDENLRDL